MTPSEEEIYRHNASVIMHWAVTALRLLIQLREVSPAADTLVDVAPAAVYDALVKDEIESARIENLLTHHARLYHEEEDQ